MDEDSDRETEAIILLDTPLLDADDLVDDEIDESDDVETEQIVLLDVLRLDGHDFDLELAEPA